MEEKSGRADKTTAAKNGRTAGWWITLLALLLIILILFFVPPERLFPGDNQANITNETNMTDGIDRNISIEGMNITDTTVQPVDMEEMYGGGFINLSNITIAIDPMALSPLTQRQVDVLLLQRQLDAIPEELRNTLLYQIITEGNQTTIDLNEYFIDPDDDALYFTTFSIPNISVTLDGSVATLTPDPSFIGLRYTVFFARDDAGAYAQSPVVNIIVVPQNITAESQTILEQYGDLPEIEQLFAEQYPGVFVDSAKEEQDRQRDRFWFMFSAFGLIVLIIIMAFILRQMQKN